MTDQLALVGADARRPAAASAAGPPAAPGTLEQTGLTLDMVTQLVLKTMYFAGELSGAEIAHRLGVVFAVIEPALEFLKNQRHCEIVGAAIMGGASYRYRVTTEGRTVASLFLQHNQYVGIAPVPLEQYRQHMAAYRDSAPDRVSRDRVREAFSHLVLSETVLDEIGPAVNGGHSIFIYGPPGNGKTVIAHAVRSLLAGDIAIPHALEIEGSIVRVFDPVTHEERPTAQEDEGLAHTITTDLRWTVCRRPMVTVGGELTLEALELNYDQRLGYYRAPLQLVANGGVLILDDFGRQRGAARNLLNRWMVPLESRIDYLTLQSGLKFEVPFLVFVAFTTNIRPSELVDEAFLRRVQYKVFTENPTADHFTRIFEKCCRDRRIPFDRTLVEHLLRNVYEPRKIPLRACHPRDLINQALLLAEYRGQPRKLTADLLETACASYFVEDRE